MKKILTIEGMHCPKCAARVKKALEALGSISAEVDLEAKSATVVSDGDVDDAVMKSAIDELGFSVVAVA